MTEWWNTGDIAELLKREPDIIYRNEEWLDHLLASLKFDIDSCIIMATDYQDEADELQRRYDAIAMYKDIKFHLNEGIK